MIYKTRYSKDKIENLLLEIVFEKAKTLSKKYSFVCSCTQDNEYIVWKHIQRHPAGKVNALMCISISTDEGSVIVKTKLSLNSNGWMVLIALFLILLYLSFRGTALLGVLYALFVICFVLSVFLEYYQIYHFVKEYLALYRS